MNFGMPLGLAFSSGINAYLPLLAFAAAARFLNMYTVNPNFAYITNEWFMLGLGVLAIADFVVDKIPAVDHIWDAIHTVVRPLAGALVVAAAGDQVSITEGWLPVSIAGGALLAGAVHFTKAATRAGSTATTGGCLNSVISVIEDFIMAVGVVLSLVAAPVMIGLIVLFLIGFVIFVPRVVRAVRKRFQKVNTSSTA